MNILAFKNLQNLSKLRSENVLVAGHDLYLSFMRSTIRIYHDLEGTHFT